MVSGFTRVHAYSKEHFRMKIQAPGSVRTNTPRRTAKTANAGGASFASHIRNDAASSGAAVGGAAHIGSVEALLAVQANVPTSRDGQSAAVSHAEDLLDRLDAIRVGLLTGRLTRTALEDIVHRLDTRRHGATDPRLAALVDEIELRAKVELAKLEIL